MLRQYARGAKTTGACDRTRPLPLPHPAPAIAARRAPSGPTSQQQQPQTHPAAAHQATYASQPSRRALRCHAAMASAAASDQFPAGFDADRFVSVANQLADAAAEVTRRYYRSPVDVEVKADASPVTIADKQAETAMRAVLQQLVPEHGIFGEEHGIQWGSGAGADYVWVIDPIDGTKSFITGKPLFGTLISLLYKGRPVLGIIDQAILKERWVGVSGRQSTLNGKPISTRACPDIKLAYLYATTPHMFSGKTETSFNRVRDAVRIPMYGCDCYAYGLLAAGFADLVVEADLKPYDYMALVPIIKGAGGVVTDWRGNELTWSPPRENADSREHSVGEILAAGDARCHAAALKLLDF